MMPSKSGPCYQFAHGRNRWCDVCGHTSGAHRYVAYPTEIGTGGWAVADSHGQDEPRYTTETEAKALASQWNAESLRRHTGHAGSAVT